MNQENFDKAIQGKPFEMVDFSNKNSLDQFLKMKEEEQIEFFKENKKDAPMGMAKAISDFVITQRSKGISDKKIRMKVLKKWHITILPSSYK